MAKAEQLSILKQGIQAWNKWRDESPETEIDLSNANLSKSNLLNINLYRGQLNGANLTYADLRGADLRFADLRDADLGGANLKNADLRRADLENADFGGTDLVGANLGNADLQVVNFHKTHLRGTKLEIARAGWTHFSDLDLSETNGLESVQHMYPSTIGTNTLQKSKGKIPEAFLRGCGLSDWEIEQAKLYNPDLSNEEIVKIQYRIFELRATQALQISPLFISYSHGDRTFVDKMDKCLTDKGIRFWRDIHDLKAGRIERQIDQAISQDRTVLLILSEHSLKSDWVEHEVRKAREIAKNAGRDTLCPVALDESWKKSPWPARIMEQIMEYNILDFSEWQDDVKFVGMFRKLIEGLELFYKA